MADLYYLHGSDANGEDVTLFIVAVSAKHALILWREFWGDNDLFSGDLELGPPEARIEDCLVIREVNVDINQLGALDWGRDLPIVGHVKP